MSLSIVIPILLGAFAGWLVNYASDVLPRTRRFTTPTCPQCGATHAWSDYLLLQACHSCGRNRTMRAWLVQWGMIGASIGLWLVPPARLGYLVGLALLAYLMVVSVIDLEHRLILHPVSLFGTLLGLGIGGWLHGWGSALLGGLVGFAILFLLYLGGVLFTGLRARRLRARGLPVDDEEALGFGDVALASVLGLLMGWPAIGMVLLFGTLLGGAISLILLLYLLISGRYKREALMVFIPFGPYFIIVTIVMLYLPNLMQFVVPK